MKYRAHLGCKIVYLQLNGNLGPIHGIVFMPLGVYGLSTNWLNGNTYMGVNMFACKAYVVTFLLGRLLIDHEGYFATGRLGLSIVRYMKCLFGLVYVLFFC